MRLTGALVLSSALVLSASGAEAQSDDPLTRAYPDGTCTYCEEWNVPQSPVRIHGDTYYVGTRGLAVILIASPEGHVLIDGALPNSAPLILENIRALGFELEDIALILNSHVHFDHAGGLAALQRATGAEVAATEASAPVLERGTALPGDPQYGELLDFPPVANVRRIAIGEPIHVGPIALTPYLTAGHTQGGTTWTWRSCDEEGCLDFVYADSQTPVSAEGFRFSDSASYPSVVTDFERGFEALETISCDVLVTPHPGASAFWQRLEQGRTGLVDREACTRYAEAGRQQLELRLESERGIR